jgi:hypothetical protein
MAKNSRKRGKHTRRRKLERVVGEIIDLDHVQLAMPAGPLEGFDRVYVADPFGNRIELLEPR